MHLKMFSNNKYKFVIRFQNRRYKCKRQKSEKESNESFSLVPLQSNEDNISLNQLSRRLSGPVLVKDERLAVHKPNAHYIHYSHVNYEQNNSINDYNYETFW